jgi:hypothetical protein
MANTKVTGDLIASSTIATGNIADNAVTSDKISGITTAHIAEGSNLYYTDARARGAVSVSGNVLSYDSSTGVITSNFEESPTFTGNVTAPSVLANSFMEIRSDTASFYFENAANNNYYRLKRSSNDFVIDYYNGTTTSDRLTIDSSGRLGIGVTPYSWSTSFDNIQIGNKISLWSASNNGGLSYNQYYNGTNNIYQTNDTANRFQMDADGFHFYQAASGTAGNSATFSESMRITSGGNVGIGTTGPSQKLEVNVASGDGILIKSADVATLKFKGSGAVSNWGFASTNLTAGDFGLYESNSAGGDPISAGTPRIILKAGGNVGIGTTSPNATLDVHAPSTTAPSLTMGAAAGQIFKNEDLEFAFGLNNASPYNGYIQTRFVSAPYYRNLAINPLGGNVGIGTNSPAHKLQVNGDSTVNAGHKFGWVYNPGADNNMYNYIQTSITPGQSYAAEPLEISGARWTSGNTRSVIFTHQTGGEIMTIMTGGYVGIKTTGPPVRLSINGWSYNPGGDASAGCVGLKQSNASSYGYVVEASANDKWMMMGHNGTNGIIETTYAASAGHSDLHIKTGSANTLVLQSSGGAVFMGRTSPDISTQDGFRFDANGEAFASIDGTAGTNAWHVYDMNSNNYRFYVSGAGQIYATSTSITAISDVTLKENIKPLETGLNEVIKLKPRRFDWKNGDGKNIAGFVAQEVEEILPDLVSESKYTDKETKKSLKMGDMIPTLVKAIQELKAEIELLKTQINN